MQSKLDASIYHGKKLQEEVNRLRAILSRNETLSPASPFRAQKREEQMKLMHLRVMQQKALVAAERQKNRRLQE